MVIFLGGCDVKNIGREVVIHWGGGGIMEAFGRVDFWGKGRIDFCFGGRGCGDILGGVQSASMHVRY